MQESTVAIIGGADGATEIFVSSHVVTIAAIAVIVLVVLACTAITYFKRR